MTPRPLFLHEEALLLALRDDQGTPVGTWYQQAIGGAVLAELLLASRIRLDATGKRGSRAKVELIDPTPLGEGVVDECLERIGASKKPRSVQDWVTKFANLRGLKQRVATELCHRGVLRLDERKVLGIFTRKTYPELDPAPEQELLDRLSRAIFGDGQDVDARTAVLISLANRTELLKANLPKKELRARKQRIEAIVNGDAVGEAVGDVIEALQAAILVVCIMPAVMS